MMRSYVEVPVEEVPLDTPGVLEVEDPMPGPEEQAMMRCDEEESRAALEAVWPSFSEKERMALVMRSLGMGGPDAARMGVMTDVSFRQRLCAARRRGEDLPREARLKEDV